MLHLSFRVLLGFRFVSILLLNLGVNCDNRNSDILKSDLDLHEIIGTNSSSCTS